LRVCLVRRAWSCRCIPGAKGLRVPHELDHLSESDRVLSLERHLTLPRGGHLKTEKRSQFRPVPTSRCTYPDDLPSFDRNFTFIGAPRRFRELQEYSNAVPISKDPAEDRDSR
jgi:hypothetical protein